MNERQRLEYLEAIGIDSYMPRLLLPNAPQSQLCQVPVVNTESATSAAIISANDSEPSPSLKSSADSVTHLTAGVKVASEDARINVLSVADVTATNTSDKPGTLAHATPVSAPNVTFALSFWRIDEDLLVMDTRHAELALPTEPLLRNILHALGRGMNHLPKAEVVRWPMLDDHFEPQHETAARNMLEAMLEGKVFLKPVKFILLMGAEACHYVMPSDRVNEGATPDATLEELLGLAFNLDIFKCTAIVTPSLSDLLQSPSLKASTWQAIQPLRIR